MAACICNEAQLRSCERIQLHDRNSSEKRRWKTWAKSFLVILLCTKWIRTLGQLTRVMAKLAHICQCSQSARWSKRLSFSLTFCGTIKTSRFDSLAVLVFFSTFQAYIHQFTIQLNHFRKEIVKLLNHFRTVPKFSITLNVKHYSWRIGDEDKYMSSAESVR